MGDSMFLREALYLGGSCTLRPMFSGILCHVGGSPKMRSERSENQRFSVDDSNFLLILPRCTWQDLSTSGKSQQHAAAGNSAECFDSSLQLDNTSAI